jgi:N-acetylglucosaminyl-diphospho-decaprenol L-rhamnosyltransferase
MLGSTTAFRVRSKGSDESGVTPGGDVGSNSKEGGSVQTSTPTDRPVSLSVVSHRQASLVRRLLGDVAANCADRVEVILTVNVPEKLAFGESDFPMPVRIVHNPQPQGFGANHNAAFRLAGGQAFCVANPDIRLSDDPFPRLLEVLRSERVGLCSPLVEAPDGRMEDSARRFPTVGSLTLKALHLAPTLDYPKPTAPFSPDWVAGMFMLFRREAFDSLGGFDERYFLYYEDVDICRRLREHGFDIRLVPDARVIHCAQRASRRSLRHVRWHLGSMWRYLTTR